ncbi:MAG: hypothetical protein E4H40_08720 [Candidatus Brocadiia bacterium]|nr:MAG: hypothetical protein E4H40_08720 [Candidatus Brocadiia bacterium]
MQILARDLAMQIDPNNLIPNAAEAGINQWRNNQPTVKAEASQSDLQLRSEYHNVLRRSIESDFAGLESLEQVRAELNSGALDSPEAIRTAATNITLFGI